MEIESNRRFGVLLDDGITVEAVYYGSGTLCISTQAGCALGCPFCASGSRGLLRNLSLDELQLQLEAARAQGLEPTRLTLSGIGEPLHNPVATAGFIRGCAGQRMPVSLTTTGSPAGRIAEFMALPHNGLMFSLHAASPSVHRRLVPHGPDFGQLCTLITSALATLSKRRRRKLGINYLLLAGINDGPEEIGRLKGLMKSWPDLTLHLLSCNRVVQGEYFSPPDAVFDAICTEFSAEGIHVRRPNLWRRQADGGCGTLFVRHLNETTASASQHSIEFHDEGIR